MQRRKRYFTIMIVPHSEEATYSFRLPLFVGQLVVALLVVALVAFFVLTYTYRNALQEAEEVRILRQANQAQQDEINAFASETQQLLERMEQIEGLAEQVADKLGINPQQQENSARSDSGGKASSEQVRQHASRSDPDRVLDRVANNLYTLQSILPEQTDSLELLQTEVDEYVYRLAATPSTWPARGRLTSGFGMRRSPFGGGRKFHYGIDIAGNYGAPICATADGQVSFVGYRRGLGNMVIIRHGYGFQTHYAHLSRFAVSSGQRVKRGQTIGYMGRTGRTTGTHLHYEVHVNGVAVNPLRYIR